ncbi:hypothetical protein BJ741DRAFT_307393 [Chytriomyces cf. hyalinus JEL632]|nr:hypothetical protein BJ741DRAFT_307393 [Chytriomyces cf. hyalinus JEL632]
MTPNALLQSCLSAYMIISTTLSEAIRTKNAQQYLPHTSVTMNCLASLAITTWAVATWTSANARAFHKSVSRNIMAINPFPTRQKLNKDS